MISHANILAENESGTIDMPWFPKNKYCWDFWFARKDGELHAFYLQASQAECDFNPDLRHNLSSIGHAVMTPAGWREFEHPALSRAKGNAWDNLSLWTGCVVEHPETKLQHLFYTARTREDAPHWTPSEWQRTQKIGLAVSPDLQCWERTGNHPALPNPGRMMGFDGVAWRDPYVIRGANGLWQVFVCARLNPEDANNRDYGLDAGAAIAYLESKSLDEWDVTRTRTLIASDEFYQMEVPQVFWRRSGKGKRFYLLFCAQEKDCSRSRRNRFAPEQCGTGTYCLSSDEMPLDYDGVPPMKGAAKLFAPGWYAGRLLDPESDAPLFFAFQWADDAGHFVGGISDPMPVRFAEDGTIEFIGT